jgi:hypothetical protein
MHGVDGINDTFGKSCVPAANLWSCANHLCQRCGDSFSKDRAVTASRAVRAAAEAQTWKIQLKPGAYVVTFTFQNTGGINSFGGADSR